MKTMRKFTAILFLLSCVLLSGNTVAAAENPSIANGYISDDSIIFYLKEEENGGQKIENVYIGNEAADSFREEQAEGARTVFLVDNSLSISAQYRENIKSLLLDAIGARSEGDTFTIATFAEDAHYLLKDSNDYLELKNQIETLQFVDQDTYFNKILYQILEELDQEKETPYTRIVIIADGVDNEKMGYTQAELENKIAAVRVPIYTVGCKGNGNEEGLKQMFSLSRLSNGKSFLMDDYSVEDILKGIKEDGSIRKVEVVPRKEDCDGSQKNIRISFGESYCQAEMVMPFREMVQEVAQTEPETTSAPAETVQAAPLPTEESNGFGMAGEIAGVIAFVLIITVLTVWGIVKLKKKGKKESSDDGLKILDIETLNQTEMLGSPVQSQGVFTEILVPKDEEEIVLQDAKQKEKRFQYPLEGTVTIGKNREKCQIVIDYDGSVSGVHCEIFKKGKQYFVRDIGTNGIASTNGTYVDGRKAAPELELKSGSVLRLGRVSFKVSFTKRR